MSDRPNNDLYWQDHSRDLDWSELSALYRDAPLGLKPPERLRTAFGASRHVCLVRRRQPDGGLRLVGAGRVLADGADAAYLCDVAVRPEMQGTGLGAAIVQRLLDACEGHSKILLYAVPGKEAFYERFGFRRMRTAMARFHDADAAFRRGHIEAATATAAALAAGLRQPLPAPAGMHLRRLGPDDAQAFQALRLRGLRDEPSAFASSWAEEHDEPLDSVARRLALRDDGGVYGALDGASLLGVVGLQREGLRQLAHKAFVWGVYVAPEARRRGLGRALLGTALQAAADLPARPTQVRQVNLGVNAANAAALALYRGLGFVAYGLEHGYLMVDGQLHDEVLMVCRLPDPAT